VTAAVLTVDLALGARTIAASLLSDFPLAGFRFYGIGNEYAALLIGTATVGLLWVREFTPLPGPALGAIFLVIAVLIGSPALGANFGEALTAVAAFLAAGQPTGEGRRPGVRSSVAGRVAALLLVLVLCALLLFVVDAFRAPEEQSHVGQLTVRMAQRKPLDALMWLGEVARRKLGMNLGLIMSAYTVSVLAVVVPFLALGYHGTGSRLRTVLAGRPSFRAGVVGALCGAVVGLIVNDSGIVVWGLTTAAALAAVLNVLLEEKERSDPRASDADHGIGRGGSAHRRGRQ
jgi:hypothetical protein